MLASLLDGCACRRFGRLGSGSSVGAKRWRWRFALLRDAAGVALLPRLVGNLEPWHRWEKLTVNSIDRFDNCMHENSFFSNSQVLKSEPFSQGAFGMIIWFECVAVRHEGTQVYRDYEMQVFFS